MNKYLSRNLLASSILSAMLASQAYAHGSSAAAPSNGPQAGAAQAPESSTSQTDASKKEAVQLQHVTVTAQRREQLVQKIPISITTLDTVQLQRMNVFSLEDMKYAVPNVVIEKNTAVNAGLKIFLRGIGQDDSSFTNEQGVALYVNDVYIPRATGAMLSVYDVERIEVLRGPQGTLFGRNATGGAIRYITKKPTGEHFLKMDTTFGSLNRRNVLFNYSTRIGNDIDVTAAVTSINRAGYLHNLTTGHDVNNEHQNAARATVAMPWGDNTYATLNLDYTFNTSGAMFAIPVKRNANGKVVNALGGDFYDTRSEIQGNSFIRTYGATLTTDTDLGFASLRNIVAARGMYWNMFEDLDGTDQARYNLYQNDKERSYSYEAQLTSQLSGPFSWVGGFFAFRETNSQPTRNDFFGFTGNTNYISQQDNSYALYWQGDYAFSDRLKLTAGTRYSFEKKNLLVVSNHPDGSQAFVVNRRDQWKRPDWKLALDYQFTPDVMGYVSATSGFKSGGFNGTGATAPSILPYKEETLVAYEAGIKSSLWNDRAHFNIDYYVNDYRGVQLAAFTPEGIRTQTNATGALIQGVEMDVQARLTSAWSVTAGLGTIKTKYQNYSEANSNTFAGKVMKDAPRFQWNLSTTYTQPLPKADLIWSAALRYTDLYYTNLALDREVMVPTHLDATARISYEPRNSPWSVALWGKNLTNNQIGAGGFVISGLGIAIVYPQLPRTYGMDFKYRFW